MNERIRELIEQATESKGFLTAGDSVPPLPVKEFNKEKFAELIVRDCISQIALLGISNCENEDISWAVDMAITNIRERFGMK